MGHPKPKNIEDTVCIAFRLKNEQEVNVHAIGIFGKGPKYNLKNWENLELLANYAQIKIDSSNPRESRLKVALALDELGKRIEACEAMTGDPPNKRRDYTLLLLTRDESNAEKFYNGFPDADEIIK